MNRVTLIGRLGRDPDVRHAQSGAVANLSVATTESWTDKNSGERKERTEWHKVVIWGKLAEIAGQRLRKGDKVFVEGKLQTRKWTDQSGQDKYVTEVVLQGFGGTLEMFAGRSGGGDAGGYQAAAPTGAGRPEFDDEIPF